MKHINRYKKRIKKISKWWSTEHQLFSALYIFFFCISIIYGALIYGMGQSIKNIKTIEISSATPVWAHNIRKMTGDYPIKNMVPYIAAKDKKTATFLVAIAKKESNWGKFSPKKDGQECYNYWGFRGSYNQTDSGYSCFDSPRQAVRVVGGRIKELVSEDFDTPKKMAVWKCGYDCSWDNPKDVKSWVDDVGYYYGKIDN